MTLEEKIALLENRILVLENRLRDFQSVLPGYNPGTSYGPTIVPQCWPYVVTSDRTGNT